MSVANLYEVRVTDPRDTFYTRGKARPNGRARTCVHRLIVSAPSRDAAEAVARYHSFKKIGQHVDDVLVHEIAGKVFDMGLLAYRTRDLQQFRMQCEADKKVEDEQC